MWSKMNIILIISALKPILWKIKTQIFVFLDFDYKNFSTEISFYSLHHWPITINFWRWVNSEGQITTLKGQVFQLFWIFILEKVHDNNFFIFKNQKNRQFFQLFNNSVNVDLNSASPQHKYH